MLSINGITRTSKNDSPNDTERYDYDIRMSKKKERIRLVKWTTHKLETHPTLGRAFELNGEGYKGVNYDAEDEEKVMNPWWPADKTRTNVKAVGRRRLLMGRRRNRTCKFNFQGCQPPNERTFKTLFSILYKYSPPSSLRSHWSIPTNGIEYPYTLTMEY